MVHPVSFTPFISVASSTTVAPVIKHKTTDVQFSISPKEHIDTHDSERMYA